MTARPAPIRQADIARAVRGVAAAGLTVVRVEVEGGKVVVYTGEAPTQEVSPLDAWRRGAGGQG
jgi:hypothetical protein